MRKFYENKFETIECALTIAKEFKKCASDLGYKTHFILKEVDDGFILEIWYMKEEK